MKPQVYLETTIPSYLTSRPSRDLVVAGHQQITREWWEKKRKAFQLFISQLVVDEVGAGDPTAASTRLNVIQDLPLLDQRFRPLPEPFWPRADSLETPPRMLRTSPSQRCTAWIS
jgi:hypothetical protein